jgi:hypothetical protein
MKKFLNKIFADFPNSIDLDKLSKYYCYFFLCIIFYQLFYYYTFYPSIIFNKVYQLNLLTKKLPLVIGLIYLMIFHVGERKQWVITIFISIFFLTYTIDDIVTKKPNFLFSGLLSGKTAYMTALLFVCPILMALATAFVGMCVWRQKDYD